MTEPAPERPREDSSPLLIFAVTALLAMVAVVDLLSPLGLAVWVFYMLPLGASLFSRSPMLPLRVAVIATALTALLVIKPFTPETLIDRWIAFANGLTAMREIRKQPAFKRLPIIALTAKAMADDRQQALEAGANDYMAKPFEVDKLVSLCRVWLPRS